MHNLTFFNFWSAAQLPQWTFDSVKEQGNSAIAERQFCTKLKWNLTYAIEISQHNLNTAFFAILDRKSVSNLQKKADIYQY